MDLDQNPLSNKLTCEDEIDEFVDTLDTGDILFFTTGLFHSIISFTIQMACNSKWTHSGMIVKRGSETLLWESVNQHHESTPFTDIRTGKPATGNGVRLINFRTYIKAGYGCLKRDGISSCIFAVLRLNRNWRMNSQLKREIEDYVVTKSARTKMVYPRSIIPLVTSWWDGWLSTFVCCGCFSTYQVEVMNLSESSSNVPTTHNHYDQIKWEKEEEIFCSQLIITTLEHTSFWKSNIPCEEWTVQDLTNGENINSWFWKYTNRIGYKVGGIEVKTMVC